MVPEVLSYSLDELVDRYPAALSFLASAGVDSDTLANLLSKAGWLKVESALRLCGVPPDALAQQIDAMDVPESLCASSDILAQLALYALLPCMLKVPVELALLRALQSSEPRGAFDRLCRFEWQDTLGLAELAHDCHDLSCFPDVVVSVGTHALFGRSFMDRFVRRGCFASVNLPEVDQALAGTGLSDPYGNFTMLAADAVVILADLARAGNLPMPRRWADFLEPEYAGTLSLCGRSEKGGFSPPMLLAIHRAHGMDGLVRFARAVAGAHHPAQMAKKAGRNLAGGTAFSAVPLFFAENVRDRPGVEVIWPEEGALAVPMNMLVRSHRRERSGRIADLLAGPEVAKICTGAHFPALHPDAGNRLPEGGRLLWIGWNTLYDPSFERLLDEVLTTFRRVWSQP
jgi:ABC-type Fe3+ transport system substrate-binding protein